MKSSGMRFGETIAGASDLPVRPLLIRLRPMMPLDQETVNNLDPVKTLGTNENELGTWGSLKNLSNPK